MADARRSPLVSGLLAGILALGGGGCPGATPGAPDDGGVPDTPGVTEAGLARCRVVGDYCTPADPCGLNPRCSPAQVCITTGVRDCDDGISCTEDRCVPGGCEHRVIAGHCLIEDRCYSRGERRGCGECDPGLSQERWTPLDGLSCDDHNPCTKRDECKQGVCVGLAYGCSDGLPCTTDSCDGQGGCDHSLKAKFCLVDEHCYPDGTTDASGCLVCDVSKDSRSLAPRYNVCTIDGKCYTSGATDPSGCNVCEPIGAPTVWTPLADRCHIGQVCVADGAVHPSGCAVCDPQLDASGWSPMEGAALQVFDFEVMQAFSLSPVVGGVGWQRSTARFTSSPASLYYGDPKTLSYDNGAPNAGVAEAPTVELPPGKQSYLALKLYLDTEMSGSYDTLQILANGTVLWSKGSAGLVPGDYRRWMDLTLELTAFAGQKVTLALLFDTNDGVNNSSEGVYVDDVTILTGCGSTD